jgi:hypothetical protein
MNRIISHCCGVASSTVSSRETSSLPTPSSASNSSTLLLFGFAHASPIPSGIGAATSSIFVMLLTGAPSGPLISWLTLSPYFFGAMRAASHFRLSTRNLERATNSASIRTAPVSGIRHRVATAIVGYF